MVRAVWVVRFPASRGAGNATFSHMYHTTYIGCVRVYLCPGPKVKTTIDNVDLTNMLCHVQCARVFSNPPPHWNCTYCTVFIPILCILYCTIHRICVTCDHPTCVQHNTSSNKDLCLCVCGRFEIETFFSGFFVQMLHTAQYSGLCTVRQNSEIP